MAEERKNTNPEKPIPASEHYDYDALKAHLKASKWSYNRLAKAMGISHQAVSEWFAKRRISGSSILKIQELTGFDPQLLTRSQPAMAPPGNELEVIRVALPDKSKEKAGEKQESARIIEVVPPKVRNVPVYGYVAAGTSDCGSDAVCLNDLPPDQRETIPMPEAFFAKYLRYPNREIVALFVRGTSMEPYFLEDDIVLVERMHSKSELKVGDNVVVDLGNGYGHTLKQWSGHDILKSINPAGPEFDLSLEPYHEATLWGRTFTMIRVRR